MIDGFAALFALMGICASASAGASEYSAWCVAVKEDELTICSAVSSVLQPLSGFRMTGLRDKFGPHLKWSPIRPTGD